mmetsp:Transcript_11863/g.17673  ORF Transcript_11863/g.17673 Transcript_11863/m.17673 type:complete len:81 (-) Transcript_11863:1301-1543(-)
MVVHALIKNNVLNYVKNQNKLLDQKKSILINDYFPPSSSFAGGKNPRIRTFSSLTYDKSSNPRGGVIYTALPFKSTRGTI